VDIVMENTVGDMIDNKFNAVTNVTSTDLRGSKNLAGLAALVFRAGIVLYDEVETLSLGKANGISFWDMPMPKLLLGKVV